MAAGIFGRASGLLANAVITHLVGPAGTIRSILTTGEFLTSTADATLTAAAASTGGISITTRRLKAAR